MKKCPKCGNAYTDESLVYCLSDGTVLEDDDPAGTEAFNAADTGDSSRTTAKGDKRVKIDIPDREEVPTRESLKEASSAGSSGKNGIGLAGVLGIVALAVVVTAGATALLVYFLILPQASSGNTTSNTANSSEVNDLKQQMEELSNRIQDGKNPSPGSTDPDDREVYIEQKRRVNSPGDGFLALRDQPSAKVGRRLAKIPHGEVVDLGACQDRTETIGGRTGRWCRVRWNGLWGWAFDVWLE
ncbi:MAG: hypothetical protein DWQ47_12320 [Acidobacteria bacterium]|nr:MAG: hypothetical protein DWQ32_14735 [Acidobacteriota bacterium]REJ98354.1 MAG: hypothetical protein DWQ38_17535 [Acidobacteriota bacterium]REK17098.1 MAG: hypothetical protein DWQ43_02580 [Acidobacteriota bacterium]REK43008.1 MAG: hypothetical protein DWQ47_12320 [Acidobacteriota bacterium]